jgi:hypothetical protein
LFCLQQVSGTMLLNRSNARQSRLSYFIGGAQ